ncbi:PREDICTED: probable LRR receptor-like protein kinase At1g51890 [Tarenaya hassleriana]|uniref:probable LRR receptor-like protein kinase At1g51890 n=1 Tax=Tarenaya hassleriana TaxID=28532 RepID=UPI00053C56E9|nr:PREDICTED: probable LRR receptor-like protein kinase At1g51890 [Tarenaya hassleriana]
MGFHGFFFFFFLIGAFAVFRSVQAQDQTGFISLDCGLEKSTTYTERTINITYESDAKYIDSGETNKIKIDQTQFQQQTWSLRYFPDGQRNCYGFNLTRNRKYLIRAMFLYGNYDGRNEFPEFDLYIGPNKWTTIDIKGVSNTSMVELIHVLTADRLQVCLVKTGKTTPFISSLELRPLRNDSYVTQSGSLMREFRVYFANTTRFIRFEEDIHDRSWIPYFQTDWSQLSTNQVVKNGNFYEPPELAMRTAAVPANASVPLNIVWNLDDISAQSYIYMHFSEIQNLTTNDTRVFNITYNNGRTWFTRFSPENLQVTTIYNPAAVSSPDGKFNFSFVMTDNSTLPPLINALEVYTVVDFPLYETDQDEVDAMMKIKATYGLSSKLSWQGDPCSPQDYRWEGLNCSYPNSDAPRVTSLNLSASGLTGVITPDISELTLLTELDLSNNDLTGVIPAFLGDMKSLKLINLRGNRKLNQSIPDSLRQKSDSLTLLLDGSPDRKSSKNNNSVPAVAIAAPVAGAAVLMVIMAVFLVMRRKKRKSAGTPQPSSFATESDTGTKRTSDAMIITKERKFTYSEVLKMTNNFERVLGKGGFGTVYHGHLDDSQVAVKMLSHSSAQGYKQFKAEVELLLRVHHRNLVSLVGYCDDGDNLALIYEYMANGDLKEHLSGKRRSDALTWATRMRIAVEAAQGLEYLHNGCKPPMVHRDVKTTNILLSEQFQAKLADFGLSRSYPVEGESHISTVVAGTPGYLDPEYYRTNWLTEKSDVYSFGVALLEIITNQPVIDKNREKPHIPEWVGFMLVKGDIRNIVDPKLNGNYDTNSVWKAVELALSCVNPSSSRRPTMPHVVMELNECLAFETSRMQGSQEMYSRDSLELTAASMSEFAPGAR